MNTSPRRPPLADPCRALVAAGLLSLLAACGGSGGSTEAAGTAPGTAAAAPTAGPSATAAPTAEALPTVLTGGPLTAPLLGTWEEQAPDGSAPYHWTFSAAGSSDCTQVVRTDGSCYVIRTKGDPRPEDWGTAQQAGAVVTTEQVGGIEASSQCVGQVSAYRFALPAGGVGAGTAVPVEKGGCRAADRNYLGAGQLVRV